MPNKCFRVTVSLVCAYFSKQGFVLNDKINCHSCSSTWYFLAADFRSVGVRPQNLAHCDSFTVSLHSAVLFARMSSSTLTVMSVDVNSTDPERHGLYWCVGVAALSILCAWLDRISQQWSLCASPQYCLIQPHFTPTRAFYFPLICISSSTVGKFYHVLQIFEHRKNAFKYCSTFKEVWLCNILGPHVICICWRHTSNINTILCSWCFIIWSKALQVRAEMKPIIVRFSRKNVFCTSHNRC